MEEKPPPSRELLEMQWTSLGDTLLEFGGRRSTISIDDGWMLNNRERAGLAILVLTNRLNPPARAMV